jgi:predicted TIM-barrel fold metal-dependent hydrolase
VLLYAETCASSSPADRYPNLNVDIGERIGELGRQPYLLRRFLIQYADRVVFGTDIPPNRSTYGIYLRCLQTEDEYFDYGRSQGRFRIYGVNLPDDVLRKIYGENAVRLLHGMMLA